jgi:hypothetical protein
MVWLTLSSQADAWLKLSRDSCLTSTARIKQHLSAKNLSRSSVVAKDAAGEENSRNVFAFKITTATSRKTRWEQGHRRNEA